MTRVVKVELQADVASYISGVLEADKATDKLDHRVTDLDKDIDKLGRDSVKAGAEVGLLGESAKKTGNDVDNFGKKTGASATEAGKLDARIAGLKTSVKDLAKEFERTGDPALLKKFRSDSSELAGLTKMRKEITTLADEAKKFGQEAEKAGMSLGDLFSGGLTSPAGIGGIAALSPLLLGAAGGLTGAVAGAGVAGAGVAGAIAGNPQVFKVEWGNAIGAIKKDWIDASAPFTGPTMDAIRSVAPLVASWHIDTTFQKAAAYVEPLVHGIEGFATGIERGVAALVDNAGPEITALTTDLPKIGDAVGLAFSLISSQASGGAQSIDSLATAIADLVVGTGAVVAGAEATVGALADASNSVRDFFDGIPGWVSVAIPPLAIWKGMFDTFVPDKFNAAAAAATGTGHALEGVALSGALAADQAKATAADYAALSTTLNATKVDADSLAASMVDKLFNGLMSLDQATLHWHESLTKIATSIAKGGDAIDENSAKGQKNVAAILGAVQANMQLYQAQMSAGMTATDAAKNYDTNTAALERQLRQAGLTSAQIDGLIGKYRGIPTRVDTAIALEGLTNAINDLDDLLRRLNGIPSRKDVTIYTHTGSVGGKESGAAYSGGASSAPAATSKSKLQPHAAGGFLDPGWNVVGEGGIELIDNSGGRQQVYSTPQSRSMMATGSFGPQAASMTGPLQLVYNGTVGGLEAIHLSWLAEASRHGQLQIHAKSVVA